MSNETHNGWTNRETWLVNLWLSNDEGSYGHWMERAREIAREQKDDRTAASVLAGEMMRKMHADADDTDRTGVFADLLSQALHRVHWDEIAPFWIDDARDQIKAEEG